jgi:hypothetical protein
MAANQSFLALREVWVSTNEFKRPQRLLQPIVSHIESDFGSLEKLWRGGAVCIEQKRKAVRPLASVKGV